MSEGGTTSNKPSFFQTLPGILTAFATLITALVGGYVAIFKEDTKKDTIELKAPDTLVAPTTTLIENRTNTQSVPVDDKAKAIVLSGIWRNSSGYINIKQDGNSITFDDWNYYGTKVGEGTGVYDGNYLNLIGMTKDPSSGSFIQYTSKLHVTNDGKRLFGKITLPEYDTQSDIYFDKD